VRPMMRCMSASSSVNRISASARAKLLASSSHDMDCIACSRQGMHAYIVRANGGMYEGNIRINLKKEKTR